MNNSLQYQFLQVLQNFKNIKVIIFERFIIKKILPMYLYTKQY